MIIMDKLRNLLKDLTLCSLASITESSFGINNCKSAVAFYDSRKDNLITSLEVFPPAVDVLGELQSLRSIVRRALRAFLHLAINPGEWTLKRLKVEADKTLLHDAGRRLLRAAIGI